MSHSRVFLPTAAVAAALVAAVSAPAAERRGQVMVVRVTMSEWAFSVAPRRVPPGRVTFRITNRGTIQHNFAIAGTRTRRLSPGRTVVIHLTFRRVGERPFLCTLNSHAEAGMRGRLRVG